LTLSFLHNIDDIIYVTTLVFIEMTLAFCKMCECR